MCRKTSKRITQTHTHTTAMTTIYIWGSAHQGITSNKVNSFVQKKWLSLPIWLVWHDVTHKHFISSLHVEHFGQSQKNHQNVTPCPKKFQHRVKSTAYTCTALVRPHLEYASCVWSPYQVDHAFFHEPTTPGVCFLFGAHTKLIMLFFHELLKNETIHLLLLLRLANSHYSESRFSVM